MTGISDFVGRFPGFYHKTAVDQLLLLAWYLEAQLGKKNFDAVLMRKSFKDAGIEPPDLSVYLPRLTKKKPPQLVLEQGGYRLSAAIRRDFDRRWGGEPSFVAVSKTLLELPSLLPELEEQLFLTETLKCYQVKAYRAATVMAWNLAFDHFVRWVFADPARLAAINAAIAIKYTKKNLSLSKREDADELKESEFIELARTSKIIDKNIVQILREKLGRRNRAAHPSRVSITQHSADDMITDLVNNVILALR